VFIVDHRIARYMNSVSMPWQAWSISEVPAASGLIGIARQPGGSAGDLDADLITLHRWRADIVVSLVEAFEFDVMSVARFPEAVKRLPVEWHHLPIADMQVPDAAFERGWVCHGDVLRQCLRRGGRVLLHCRGGLGRSGMIAARLLVEMGVDPEAAIASVRSARPGAIETAAQEAHVRACRMVDPVPDCRVVLNIGE
jgi:ADP-ribosyl-[dinitrogen reductase] hydrolase